MSRVHVGHLVFYLGCNRDVFQERFFTPLGKHLARDLMSPVQFFSTSPGLEHEEEVLSFSSWTRFSEF